jgi:hypothetical protein
VVCGSVVVAILDCIFFFAGLAGFLAGTGGHDGFSMIGNFSFSCNAKKGAICLA